MGFTNNIFARTRFIIEMKSRAGWSLKKSREFLRKCGRFLLLTVRCRFDGLRVYREIKVHYLKYARVYKVPLT